MKSVFSLFLLPSLSLAWDPTLITNCQSCTATTQPDCMILLETANTQSPYFDIAFAGQVSCSDLEFAFECVLLKNPAYPLGYLEYYFRLPETANDTVCETYADEYDTMSCNVECVEAGSDVQEGAEEFLCEQCEESTVSACFNYLGYSGTDPDMTCDSKRLAFECLKKNFSSYPNGYLAYVEEQRGQSCDDIAAAYGDSDCPLTCEPCPSTCLFDSCDAWVQKGVNTCAGLESMDCDCSGCSYCDSAMGPAPAPDDGWIVQTTTKCGRGELGANEVSIGANGYSYDTIDHETFDVSDCKATCEASSECAGFSLEFHTTETCWYVADTSLYVSSSSSESCYTYVGKGNSGPHDVSWCEHCSSSTAEACFTYLTYAAHNASTPCSDLELAMSCLEDQDYFTTAGMTCSSMEGQLNPTCGISCPSQCAATCNYNTCDELIDMTDQYLSCASIENAWGCDCQSCGCQGSSSNLAAIGYAAAVGTACQYSDFGANTNRVTIATLGATFARATSITDCASYCDGEVLSGGTCGGFSYDIVNQECVFVDEATTTGSTTSGEYMCLTRTSHVNPPTTTTAGTTSTTGSSDTTAEDLQEGVDGVAVGVSVAVVVVVAGVVAIVVYKLKTRNDPAGFSPQHKKNPTTYAAPKTPGSIDADKQIDQDGFEL